jgi:hypothetical protein
VYTDDLEDRMIQLNHVEVGDPEGFSPEPGTLVRFWQAEVPETDLFAITEEGLTRIPDSGEPNRYQHLTRFFVATGPYVAHTVQGQLLVQEELHHGDHRRGPIGPAIRELIEPTSWNDAPRQQILAEAIERHAQANA